MGHITYIYGLFENTNHSLLYVGHTSDLRQRYGAHRSGIGKEYGDSFYMEVLEQGDSLTAEDETFWIQYALSLGCVLKNKQTKVVSISRPKKRNTTTMSVDGLESVMNSQGVWYEQLAKAANLWETDIPKLMTGQPITPHQAADIETAFILGVKRLAKISRNNRMELLLNRRLRRPHGDKEALAELRKVLMTKSIYDE